MISVAGILVSLVLLMYLAYRNHNVIVIAPICALVAVGLDGELPLLAVYTQIFLDSLGKFIVRYFALFLLGAIFGKLMVETDSVDLRGANLWWSVAFCRCLYSFSVSGCIVSSSELASAAHPRIDRAGSLHIHHDCVARLGSNSKFDSHAIFQDNILCSPGDGLHRCTNHVFRRNAMAQLSGHAFERKR